MMRERQEERRKLLGSTPDTSKGLMGLVSAFSSCIGCRACREACPVCSCTLCNYEKAGTVHSQDVVYDLLENRGSLRIPSGTLQFHIGRMIHVSPYCTGCGQCSDVCPVDIPVAELFVRAAEMVQNRLDCHPGNDPQAPAVMATYRQKELLDITD
jgi:formate dehydrogenase subunit beta